MKTQDCRSEFNQNWPDLDAHNETTSIAPLADHEQEAYKRGFIDG